MPAIIPVTLDDLPLEYVSKAWYTEASGDMGAGTLASISAEIPTDAAVLQLLSVDVARESSASSSRGRVHLAVGNQSTEPAEVRAMGYYKSRHQFVQHMWLGLPAGTHTFRAEWRVVTTGARAKRRMMALLLLKR